MLLCRLKVNNCQSNYLPFCRLDFFLLLYLVVGFIKRRQTVSEAQSFGTPDAQLTNKPR